MIKPQPEQVIPLAIDVIGDLSIQVTNVARLDDTASIKAKNLFFSVYDFYNQADITITDNATFDIGNDFNNGFYLDGYQDGGDISAGSFNVTAGDDFYNLHSATINADNFNVTAYDFSNSYNATINADNFNVTTGYGFSNSATINANNFNVTADDFNNSSASATISADNFNVTAYSFLNLHNATISADNFNVSAGADFFNYNKATISADNFNVTAGDRFYNFYNATISADSLNISYNRLHNTDIIIGSNASYFGSIFIENVNTLPIVPDGASSTDAIQSSSGIDIINIARPDGNGISNNSYSDFNVLSSGLVFNNSASAVSSSLAGTIAGNPNYSASDSASLILNQITSNNASYLGGMLEVAGDSAGIIIANPNGIVCDGCSFANTDKVDLITAGDDVFIYNANIILREFNVTAGYDFYNWGNSTISADSFHATAGDDFYNRDNATISADSFHATAGGDFYNRDNATISADSFNVTAYSFSNSRSTINTDNFNVTAGDDFTIGITQQSVRITSMLQQNLFLTILIAQSMRIVSMLQQRLLFQ